MRSPTDEQLCADAARDYETHVVRDAGDDRWLVRRADGQGMFWAEIAVLRGRVVVVGDGPDIVFYRPPGSPLAAVHWLATGGVDYLESKVLAGNRRTWRLDDARADIAEHIDQMERDDYGDDEVQSWRDAIGLVHDEMNEDAFISALYACEIDVPYEYGFGRRTHSDVYYARAAARRLVELLEAEEVVRACQAE